MEDFVFSWGFDVVQFLRSFATPQLDTFMRVVTTLGSAPVFLLIVLVLFWCIDEKKGMRLGTMLLISVWINLALKLFLNMPRPFFDAYDPEIAAIPERLGGFPSGHAQNSLVVFVIIASWVKEKWQTGATVAQAKATLPYFIAAIVCLLIGFSRVYLGVHFPGDVIGGWLIAGLLLCAYFLLHGKIEALLQQGGFRAGMIACATLSFIMIFNQPAEELLAPSGLMLGLGTGYCLNCRYIGFSAPVFLNSDNFAKNLMLFARCVAGAVVLALIFYAYGKLLPQGQLVGNYRLLGFFRFVIASIWISAGAPWLFCKIKLGVSTLQASVPQTKEGQ